MLVECLPRECGTDLTCLREHCDFRIFCGFDAEDTSNVRRVMRLATDYQTCLEVGGCLDVCDAALPTPVDGGLEFSGNVCEVSCDAEDCSPCPRDFIPQDGASCDTPELTCSYEGMPHLPDCTCNGTSWQCEVTDLG